MQKISTINEISKFYVKTESDPALLQPCLTCLPGYRWPQNETKKPVPMQIDCGLYLRAA